MSKVRTCRSFALVSLLLTTAVAAQEPLEWPTYGPERDFVRVDDGMDRGDGLTNSVPDIVGPVDGSAKLTIFTEGNHYPVLLPIVLEAFPRYCAETGRCSVTADEIMVVTLPQVMIVSGLERGGFRFGNAQLPVAPDGPVYPDLVMLGEGAMTRLHEMSILASAPRVFAKHRGMGLLIDKQFHERIPDLETFAQSDLAFVLATPRETGARRQYIDTLSSLLGMELTQQLLSREIEDFPGRMAIQHRDIPYAVMNEVAPVGIVFGHFASFYADHWNDRLAFVELTEARPFGSEIAVARTTREVADPALIDAFLEFLFEVAPEVYEEGGFSPAEDYEFGRELEF